MWERLRDIVRDVYVVTNCFCFDSGDRNSTETNPKQSDAPSASTSPHVDDVTANDVTVDDVPVDENLFTEDLDGLEDELEGLDI